MDVDTHNNTLSSKQNIYRAGISQNRKKKAQKLVPKIAAKSKVITKAKDYNDKVKRRSKKLSLKKKDFRPHNNPMVAPKRLDKKQKKKLGKSLWESTHDIINPKDIDSDFSDEDSGMSEEETKKVVDGGAGTGGGESESSDGEIDLKVIKKVVKKVREEG